ncbi:Solute carrier family 26 member 6 [Bagarius yarrelli]|uniref:Solute carrier family 26 member 6 n=1 Tax=Bagarius yarrelli TaxID=175774 RepID=A0A556VY31_BAGYA|nr:Solute carrier family 26 member 6 [Bagarius yarrelli]
MVSGKKSLEFCVEREILDEEKLEKHARRLDPLQTYIPFSHRLKNSLRCSIPRLKRRVTSCLPVLYWLPRYSIWDYGMPDLISGISVGIMHLPQERLAPDSNFLIFNGTNVTEEVNITARDLYRVQVAAATTVLGGLIQVILGLAQFGFVGTYLSEPLVRAYTTAAAAHAVVAQLKYIFGTSPRRFSGPLSLVYTLINICEQMPDTHLPTLLVSGVSIIVLITAKELNSRYREKLPVPIPVELIITYEISVVGDIPSGLHPPAIPNHSIFSDVVVEAFALAIVGYAISISLGKTFALKHGYKVCSNQELVALGLSNTVGGFFQCFSVCASMSRSLIQETTGGRTQAKREQKTHTFSSFSSLSTMAGVAAAVVVLVTTLKLGPLFQQLPKAVLAAIVFVNLKSMFKQYADIVTLWRRSKTDLLVWLVTWVSTILFNMDMGLAASIGFALLTVIFRTQRPRYSVLGHLPGTELYLDMETHQKVKEVPGITIFRSSATIYFANAELYLEALKEKSGLDITKMITYKRRQEEKQRRRERRAERRAKRAAKRQKQALRAASQRSKSCVFSVEEEAGHLKVMCGDIPEDEWRDRENGTVFVMPETPHNSWVYLKGTDPETTTLGSMSDLQDGDLTTLESSSEDTLSRDLERVSLGSLGKWTWDIHSIILDLSTVNFIDTVAIKTLKNIIHDFGEIDVNIYIAGCQIPVVEQLEQGGFFTEISKERLFTTVHDAVLYCLKHNGAAHLPSYEIPVV